MAKIFKIDGYVVDFNNQYDNIEEVETELENGLYDGNFVNFSKKISNSFEWHDDIDINFSNAKKEDYEKYFSKNQAKLLKYDDWEGLYINNELKDEGHTLNEGEERVLYFIELSKKYNFDLKDLKCYYLSDDMVIFLKILTIL